MGFAALALCLAAFSGPDYSPNYRRASLDISRDICFGDRSCGLFSGIVGRRSSTGKAAAILSGVSLLALIPSGLYLFDDPRSAGHRGQLAGQGPGARSSHQTAPDQYTGTYTDTVAKEKGPGKIELKWSQIERRFNGTWREGDDDRFGNLSVRLMDKVIRGG